jgi:hypothetical protein
MTPCCRRAMKPCRFTDRAQQSRRLSAEIERDGGDERSIKLERRALDYTIEQNPLDLLDISRPNGRDFPTIPSGRGWFSDALNFDPQRLLPRDGRSCRSDFGGSSGAVPASFLQFLYTEASESRTDGSSGMSPPRSERLNQQSVGLVQLTRPMQSGEECCKKRIPTSVIAVPFRRAWF